VSLSDTISGAATGSFGVCPPCFFGHMNRYMTRLSSRHTLISSRLEMHPRRKIQKQLRRVCANRAFERERWDTAFANYHKSVTPDFHALLHSCPSRVIRVKIHQNPISCGRSVNALGLFVIWLTKFSLEILRNDSKKIMHTVTCPKRAPLENIVLQALRQDGNIA
jgi:hypothetical protein